LDIRAYAAAVPEMDRFLTVDELNEDFERLAREHPDFTVLERVGSSQLGAPIRMLSIGSGSRNVLMFACPHPNEPIGAMMVHYLARLLCDDAELRNAHDYTWHLINCVDPDGTRLNENWFAGPFTVRNYARNFYRPAGHKQVEWTFPASYKTNYFDQSLPETEMLMRVIDRLQPVLMGSLHNAGFGGVYYYLSRDLPELHETLYALPEWENLPLSMGEPEVPYITPFAPAIFPLIASSEAYDYMEANGADLSEYSHGGSSSEYADKYGTLTMMIEEAYFDDPRVNDTSVTETNRRQAILEGLDRVDTGVAEMASIFSTVKDELRTNSTFETAVGWYIKSLEGSRKAERTWAETDPDTDRPATVAELFSSNQEARFYSVLLPMGMLVRMLEGEISTGNGTPKIREQYKRTLAAFDTFATDLENDLQVRVAPIRNLVAVQLGAVLAAADHLA